MPARRSAHSREPSRRSTRGAQIILGPLFALSVPATAQLARARGVSVIAFSTDSSIAGRGVYLLSFLPESDVNRIIEYSASIGKRSFAAMLPDNAYGNVVEASFKQAVGRRGGRVVSFEKYGIDRSARRRPSRRRSVRPTLSFSPTMAIRSYRSLML